jgi:predicted transcriptional regulator of viral defense system
MFCIIMWAMKTVPPSQKDKALSLLAQYGMARLSEFISQGITAATVSRMQKKGLITQLGRGLYQLPDAPLDANHSLAEAAKLVPRGIVCLDSALAFHGLTDHIPPRVWMAIGFKEWKPTIKNPPIIIVRFNDNVLEAGIETHSVENIPVRVYSPAKTIADLFYWLSRARRFYGPNVSYASATHGMKEALRLRKATPAEIADYAAKAGVWKIMRPYLETLKVDV